MIVLGPPDYTEARKSLLRSTCADRPPPPSLVRSPPPASSRARASLSARHRGTWTRTCRRSRSSQRPKARPPPLWSPRPPASGKRCAALSGDADREDCLQASTPSYLTSTSLHQAHPTRRPRLSVPRAVWPLPPPPSASAALPPLLPSSPPRRRLTLHVSPSSLCSFRARRAAVGAGVRASRGWDSP